ncbi:MAG: AI-2E family transporter, partial [Coriobacteriales bacterium]|nr:AI-2E family transporter [Coriobacteriales bacterium]
MIIGIGIIAMACGTVIGQVWTSISVILFSAFLVFILRVPVAWMERHRVPRAAGAAIAYLATLVIIAALLLLFVPVIVEQVVGFTALLPSYISDAQTFFSGIYNQYYEFIQDQT